MDFGCDYGDDLQSDDWLTVFDVDDEEVEYVHKVLEEEFE